MRTTYKAVQVQRDPIVRIITLSNGKVGRNQAIQPPELQNIITIEPTYAPPTGSPEERIKLLPA